MKSHYKIALLLLLVPALSFGNLEKVKGKYTKEKKVSKEFKVNPNAGLSVENSYGNINIVTWNENRTVIEVIIKSNGNNESKVQEKLNDVSIEINGSDTHVSAKTTFNSDSNNWNWKNNKNNHVSFEIIYTIKIPKGNSIDLTNKYGAITVTSLNGVANINATYGEIVIGDLNADNNNINMRYIDHATINYMKSGKIDADYSDFSIEKTEDLELVADYTKSNIANVDNLNYRNRYGKLKVGNAGKINGKASYNGAYFGIVKNNLNINARYSTINVENTGAEMNDINIDGSYSKISLGLHPDYNFKFKANLGYGSLKGASFMTMTSQNKKGSKSDYEGYFGNINSEKNININSRYGSVTLTKI